MKQTLKSLSALLGYPSAELKEAVGEIRRALEAERALPQPAMARLESVLARLETVELMTLQCEYTDLFDGSRSLSLHLFEHVHGESRDRGQAMIDLGEQYIAHGFVMAAHELPDYLPLFLEFLSFIEPRAARDWLSQPAHVFAAIEERLTARQSPYAAVFGALLALPQSKPDADALAALRARMAADEAVPLDDRWEEEPVTFGPAPPAAAKGVTARIRMALKR